MIYVPAQTHLIYSAKHNSLTLFWGKTVVYLGYATKSRKLRHSYVHSTPAPSIFPRYFTFRLFLFAILLSFTHYINHRVPCTFFATLSLFLFLSLRVAINTRSISYFLLDPTIANAISSRSNDTRCVTFMNRFFAFMPSIFFFHVSR